MKTENDNTEPKREPGHYHIKFKGHTDWTVGMYCTDGNEHEWYVSGARDCVDDKFIEEIDPRPITRDSAPLSDQRISELEDKIGEFQELKDQFESCLDDVERIVTDGEMSAQEKVFTIKSKFNSEVAPSDQQPKDFDLGPYKHWNPVLSFHQCLREEFLFGTENYPKEYHKLFHDIYERAERRFKEQQVAPSDSKLEKERDELKAQLAASDSLRAELAEVKRCWNAEIELRKTYERIEKDCDVKTEQLTEENAELRKQLSAAQQPTAWPSEEEQGEVWGEILRNQRDLFMSFAPPDTIKQMIMERFEVKRKSPPTPQP